MRIIGEKDGWAPRLSGEHIVKAEHIRLRSPKGSLQTYISPKNIDYRSLLLEEVVIGTSVPYYMDAFYIRLSTWVWYSAEKWAVYWAPLP